MPSNLLLRVSVLLAIFASEALALSPIIRGWSGQWKDATYFVSARSGEHLRAVSWDPEKEDAPLSVKRAIAIARVALKKIVADAEAHFACEEVLIVDDSGRNGPWHYVIRFGSDHPSMVKTEIVGPNGEVGIYPAIFPFVVYLDGTVESPEKTQKG